MDKLEEKAVCDKFLFGDIGVSLETVGVEESSSSNKCCARLRQFSVTDTITGVYKKFFRTSGDAQRSRIRNKVKAFVGYSMDAKNKKKGIFHWVLGSNLVRAVYWEKKGWEDVCCDMGMDKNSYYKRRRGIIKKLSWLLGFD